MNHENLMIEVGLDDLSSYEKIIHDLKSLGIKKDQLDSICKFRKRNGLSLVRGDKSSFLATKYFFTGAFVGAFVYFVYLLFQSQFNFSYLSRNFILNDFIHLSLGVGVILLILGYIIGKRFPVHFLAYQSHDKEVDNIVLTINIKENLSEQVVNIIEAHAPGYLQVIDLRKEIELGLRAQ